MRILLITVDHLSHLNQFPMGVAYIAAVALEEGHEVEIWNQELYHYPDEEIETFLNSREKFDVVGVGVYGYQMFQKSISVCKYINRAKNRPEALILGSNGPSACPEYFITETGADYVVHGEGETSWVGLIDSIEHKTSKKDLLGIAYMDGSKLVMNPASPLVRPVDDLPFPAWDLFPIDAYALAKHESASHTDRCFTALYSRGCPQSCNFCFRLYDSYRLRSFDSLFEELRILKSRYNITFIEFVDENIMINEKAAIRFGEAMLKENTKEKGLGITWACHGVTPSCTKEALTVMKAAGMKQVNLGIESLSQEVINNITKKQTPDDAIRAVENCAEIGVMAGLNIIWGNIGDTPETLKLGADFLVKYNNTTHMRSIKPVTPYPGTPLYFDAIKLGLLSGPADFYDKYENSDRMTCNFTNVSDDEFYRLLYEANSRIVESFHKKQAKSIMDGYHYAYYDYNRELGFSGPRIK